jgi:hypothetical protein
VTVMLVFGSPEKLSIIWSGINDEPLIGFLLLADIQTPLCKYHKYSRLKKRRPPNQISSSLKEILSSLTFGVSFVSFTPAAFSILFEALTLIESAYLSERYTTSLIPL